jgi:O-antigen/teichoic acid export membrane protein
LTAARGGRAARLHVADTGRRFAPLLASRTFWQASGFAGSNLLASLLAVVAAAMLTRNLSTTEFGSYSFAISLLFFVALFFEFGIVSPAARQAALGDAREGREIVGATLLLYVPIGIAFSLTILILSYWVDDWFHVDAGGALRVSALAALGFPLVLVIQRLAQGVDRLHIASATTPLAQLLLVVFLAVTLQVTSLGTTTGVLVRSIALLLSTLVGAVWLRPLFGSARRYARVLVRETREWGFQIYIGRIASIGTYNMDVLMLGIWANARSVGFYSLAGSIAIASGMPVFAMSTALFAKMARTPRLERRWIVIAIAVGAVCALAAWLVAEPAIRVLFSPRYAPAAALVLPLALAQFVRGITTLFVNFMSAHGHGREMRNAGLILTGSNIVLNFALIPPFGAQGAAWASLLALMINLGGYTFYYRRHSG